MTKIGITDLPPALAEGGTDVISVLAAMKCCIMCGESWSPQMQEAYASALATLRATPSPQPPAPAEGGTDVVGLVDKLSYYSGVLQEIGERNSACHYLDIAEAGRERLDWARNIKRGADALTTQAAEISQLRDAWQTATEAARQFCRDIDAKAAALAAKEAEIAELRERVDDFERREAARDDT